MRITKMEVSQFCETGYIQEKTQFLNNIFTYALSSKEGLSALTATYEDNMMTLLLPKDSIKDWESSNRVGFSNSIPLEDGKTLTLLVEKDFTCLEDRGEDETDNYPNPKLHH